jgi:hypothetical protein
MSYGDLWQFVAVLTRVLNIVADSVGGWGGIRYTEFHNSPLDGSVYILLKGIHILLIKNQYIKTIIY